MSDFPDDFPLSDYDHEEYLAHESMEAFDDWGDEEPDYEDYWDEEFGDPEPFDPATEVVEIIDIDTVITLDGRVLKIEIRIFADEHQEDVEYFLEDTCCEPFPF